MRKCSWFAMGTFSCALKVLQRESFPVCKMFVIGEV